MKDKKNLFVVLSVLLVVIVGVVLAMIFLKNGNDKTSEGNKDIPGENIVTPDAPAENTESLVQAMEKVEVKSLTNDVIEFSENVKVQVGEKVAVWVYSTPKFLGYFDVVMEDGVKVIKGLEKAMKDLNVEAGEHNLAIVTESGTSVGYIDVYIEENKLFEDEKAAEVSKYTTKEVTEEVEVKYQTETRKDSNKGSGYKEVIQKGINGVKKITYKITLDEDGKEVSKEVVSEKEIKKAVNEIILVGSADFNINSSMITSEATGFMCTANQLITYQGEQGCDDSQTLPMFNLIGIDSKVYYVVTVDEKAIPPVKVIREGKFYKGTYNGSVYYFEPRGGGGGQTPLTEDLCKKYNLSCGSW
ncbi:MAG: G5 domain-containing protein [Bacilli bacterium]|nr:G5 domain-containing protein [Bacilli bacterium]